MTAASASTLNAGEIAAPGDDAPQAPAESMPSGAILALRGALIALGLSLIAALAGAGLSSLLFGYPIGRLA